MRTLISLLIGLLLCLVIWAAVPYNNFALNNSFISDSYLPEVVLLCLVPLVLVANPLLRKAAPGGALDRRQLALICGMMLFAAVLPSNGLMRFFPHSLAVVTEQINRSTALATAVAESDLPPQLFPDPIAPDGPTPVSSQLVDELDPGASIPWSAWVTPLLAWGTLIVAFWVLMIGMGLMVFPQWLNIERLSFPLLKVYHAILEPPQPGQAFPPLFRSRLFWIGCGVVFFLHSINGLAIFTHGRFPTFPLSWDLKDVLTEGIWRHTPGFLANARIYFLFVGLAYFMPNRYSFSIWFTVLFFGIVSMWAQMYMPGFSSGWYYDQGSGALLAMAIGVVWLGRQHYWRVLQAAVGLGHGGDEASRDAWAGRLFLGGAAVMFGWFIWAGAGPFWAGLFLIVAIIVMLMVTRIVAETGITFLWILPFTATRFVSLFPSKWSSIASTFLQDAHYILVNRASAVSTAMMMVLALGLNPTASPRTQRRMAGIGITVLVLGLLVCGAVHLNMGYHLASSLDGANTPVTGRGSQMLGVGRMMSQLSGREAAFPADSFKMIVFGTVLAGILLMLCARFPAWPLHPIGLIFVHSSIGLRLFMSLFIGWLIKTLLVQLGGARAYRLALPLFLGLIFGEIFANAFWTLVPVVQLLLGADPSKIDHMVIFQYT